MKPSTGKKLAVSIIFGYILSVILLAYLIKSEASNVRTTISEIQRLQGSIKNSGGVPGGIYIPMVQTIPAATVKPYRTPEVYPSKKIKCIEVSGVKYLAEHQGDGVYKIMDVSYQERVKTCGQGRRQT